MSSALPHPIPEPKPVTLDPKTTAVLVLDLNARCDDPKLTCSQLAPVVAPFLDKARQTGSLIIYTVSASVKGTPLGEVWSGFKRRETEPVIFPDAFDKFASGELQQLLQERGTRTVIVTGAATNFAVLYTSTAAARMYGYDVIVPVDGAIASSSYEHEYSLFQFTVLPGVAKKFTFTALDLITFAG